MCFHSMPRIEALSAREDGISMIQAIWKNQVIAESDDTLYVEGNHYFPMNAVKQSFLETSDTTSFCSWKGIANYFNLVVNGEANEDAAWYYEAPTDAASKLAGRIAFWRGVQVVEA